MDIPLDIVEKIKAMYPSISEQSEVEAFIFSFWTMNLNVGPAQLARAVLHLSKGNIDTIRNIAQTNFYGDPRDLIVIANGKPGEHSAGSYFNEPFA